MSRKRVAILISGGGSNMVALAKDMRDANHPAKPVLVVSNTANVGGLTKAADLGIPAAHVDHRPFKGDRQAFEKKLQEVLLAAKPDIICLAGFMRVLTPEFVAPWRGKMLNIHPSILPLFPGLHTHQRTLDAGMTVQGCTVHQVTGDLDAGPILGQAIIPVLPGDTAETLAARLLPFEHQLYPQVLRKFASGDTSKITLFGDQP
ncbi:MAG: phosphoribosylglycinamide formyltransferase [Rhodobacteraceae bacterium]|nr:phosphoribosylglycinamide formyltransferase [Paracoccaceae bacterium]